MQSSPVLRHVPYWAASSPFNTVQVAAFIVIAASNTKQNANNKDTSISSDFIIMIINIVDSI